MLPWEEKGSRIPFKLLDFESSENILTLKSEIKGEEPLNLANAFLLSLDNSEFINFNSVDFLDIKNKSDKDSKTFILTFKQYQKKVVIIYLF